MEKRAALLADVSIVSLCLPQAAMAQSVGNGQSGQKQEDTVLVPGISASDYLTGKRAKNGSVRAALTQGNVNYYREQFEQLYQITLPASEGDEFQRRLVAAWPDGKNEAMGKKAATITPALKDKAARDTVAQNAPGTAPKTY